MAVISQIRSFVTYMAQIDGMLVRLPAKELIFHPGLFGQGPENCGFKGFSKTLSNDLLQKF